MARSVLLAILAAWLAIAPVGYRRLYAADGQLPAARTSATPRAVLDQYCVTCHNERLKTAGLMLDTLDLIAVPARAEVWEKVIRKLRTGAMPPAGRPRPDKATSARLTSWIELQVDRDAAARPNPGRSDAIHRLNRAEYRNAIRDLLALDTDVASMLPVDDMSYGFDNIAGVLKVTPSLLDRYMAAARQISRLAIGNSSLPPTAETFRLKSDLSQDDNFDNLPMGTRGGTAIRYQFPLDADYIIKVEPLGGGADSHPMEISVDGERAQLVTLNPRSGLGQGQGYDSEGQALEFRVSVKAGPHVVGVTFVRRTGALLETVREPFLVPHSEGAPRAQPSIASVTITGPIDPRGAGSTPSRERVFVCHPNAGPDKARPAASPARRTVSGPPSASGPPSEDACARTIVSTLARRAYRRPATGAEVDELLKFYDEGHATAGFENGIELALRRLLMSPEFLFRIETEPAGVAPGTAYRVTDLDLASRLSFFIWSSIPDEALLDAAIKGTLRQPGVLEQQVRRMLADPRAKALSTNFAGQWLQLRTIEGSAPNEYLFPNFGENLRQDFRHETELFFDSVLRENRSVLDLLTADYTFVNERLAKHYAIPNVYGSHFRRVTLADPNRRGLLGQGSFLTATSLADRTTVVARGKWILDNMLGAPPPPPPPNVPPLDENKSGRTTLSLRARMEQHRENPVCASCHARMDPLGFALENFDATGQWRTREGDTPIDASAALPDGTTFEGPSGLRSWLLSQPQQVVAAATEKLLIYALGRGIEYYDAPAVRKIVQDAAGTNYRLQSLILGVAKSTPFQMRKSRPRDSE